METENGYFLGEEFLDPTEGVRHYGTPRHSGRYPWGSGDNPNQHEDWYKAVNRLKAEGLSDTEIAKTMNLSTPKYRARKSIVDNEIRQARYREARRLQEELGNKWTEIGKRMGINESSVRTILNDTGNKEDPIMATADILRNAVKDKKYVDVGQGAELQIGVSKTRLDTAIAVLEEEGYNVYTPRQAQAGMPGKYTTLRVLTDNDTTMKDVLSNRDKLSTIIEYRSSEEGSKQFGIEPPASFSSKRLQVRYDEDGGGNKDGIIEIRRGLKDVNLGDANYAQVRIAVDGTHYLKGVALYADDLPDGVDIRFNTSKTKDVPIMGPKDNSVLKPLKTDEQHKDNPFGATIRVKDGKVVGQKHYIGDDGKEHLSPVNIVSEEGDWGNWSKTLASQFLSKQDWKLAKQQLDLEYDKYMSEYEAINRLTVPEIKKTLMTKFASQCDSAAVHLKAHALPNQCSKVILPLPELKPNEIYNPGLKDGEEVILVRYPHAGIFEIPRLRVNNKCKAGIRTIGPHAPDAVGIHPDAAKQLSGADFDGDTVVVIPTKGQKLKSEAAIAELKDFTETFHKTYAYHDGMKVMTKKLTQQEMGKISNLITDMQVQGADQDKIIRAVKHSMVIIDAEKHKLDYMQSFVDNDIASLKEEYQGGVNRGAATLISRASSQAHPPERKPGEWRTDENGNVKRYYHDPETGVELFTPTGRLKRAKRKNKETGEEEWYTTNDLSPTQSTKMAEARTPEEVIALMSNNGKGTVIEKVYADYAIRMKELANQARLDTDKIGRTVINPQAKETYAEEIKSLDAKLKLAMLNKPLERKAQALVGAMMKELKEDNPEMTAEDEKKIKNQRLVYARNVVGADKSAVTIRITDREWEALISGAVSSTKMDDIFKNSDLDAIKARATPRTETGLSSAMIARIQRYGANGNYTLADIADALGVSASTVSKYLKS